MSKQEFINRLRVALLGNVSTAVISENVKYYEEYINTQIRLGKKEAAVLDELGDPRLIARTIIAANGDLKSEKTTQSEVYGEKDRTSFGEKGSRFQWPIWLKLIVTFFVVMVAVTLVVSVLSYFAPIIIMVVIIIILIKKANRR